MSDCGYDYDSGAERDDVGELEAMRAKYHAALIEYYHLHIAYLDAADQTAVSTAATSTRSTAPD